jgi:hypothetical protein
LDLAGFSELEEVCVPFNTRMSELKISECPKVHTIFLF